jgi:hypothetical protein
MAICKDDVRYWIGKKIGLSIQLPERRKEIEWYRNS